jgi:phage FluMu protein Com
MLPKSVRGAFCQRYPEVSDMREEISERFERCELCGVLLDESGDNWDGLCPRCADVTSEYMDAKGLNDEERPMAVRAL